MTNQSMLVRAKEIQDQMIRWRREVHMYPELGFQETRTAGLVAETLTAMGYRVRTGVGRTGVVADRGQDQPIVAIRADMDALPIQEENNVPYASQIPGVMHACGHDAHTAIAMGVAKLLAEESFPGTVRLLFQPSEEMQDQEGLSGAQRMVADGAMEGVQAILALHVNIQDSVGDIQAYAGPASGGVDSFHATVAGQGGHGAYPHKTIDPIHLAGHVILALHGIVSRRLDPFDEGVITVGSIHGGQASNVIPEQVKLSGTLRYMQPAVQKQIHAQIEQALAVARTLGGDYELEIELGYPPTFNDERMIELVREVVGDLLGMEHIRPREKGLGAEDFGYFCTLAPGAMFRLGAHLEGAARTGHSPTSDIDERCLPIGAAILAESVLRLLRRKAEAR